MEKFTLRLHDGCRGNSNPILLSQNDTRIVILNMHLRCGWTHQTILSILFYFSSQEFVCQNLFLHLGPLAETGASATVLKTSTQWVKGPTGKPWPESGIRSSPPVPIVAGDSCCKAARVGSSECMIGAHPVEACR